MADLIDRQQALALRFTHAINEDGVVYVQYREYQNGIVRLPSANCQQVTGKLDCISRQAAIVAVKDALLAWSCMPAWRDDKITEALVELPSAQPEQQMKCSGCRYDNHASGWSEHCVLCRRNYLNFKDRYERRT